MHLLSSCQEELKHEGMLLGGAAGAEEISTALLQAEKATTQASVRRAFGFNGTFSRELELNRISFYCLAAGVSLGITGQSPAEMWILILESNQADGRCRLEN